MTKQLPFIIPESELIMTLSTFVTMKHVDSISQSLMEAFKKDGYSLEEVMAEVTLLGFDVNLMEQDVVDFLQVLMVLASEFYPDLL